MSNILNDFSPRILTNAVEANMAEQFAFFSHSPLADVDDSPERLRYLSGVPIYDVAAAKAARRQGIGAAVTLAPLLRARALGYRIGVLQASEMGTGVYTRLGFRQVCSFALYAWEPES